MAATQRIWAPKFRLILDCWTFPQPRCTDGSMTAQGLGHKAGEAELPNPTPQLFAAWYLRRAVECCHEGISQLLCSLNQTSTVPASAEHDLFPWMSGLSLSSDCAYAKISIAVRNQTQLVRTVRRQCCRIRNRQGECVVQEWIAERDQEPILK